MPAATPAKKNLIPIKRAGRNAPRRPTVSRAPLDNSAQIRMDAARDGAQDFGNWDKVFMLRDDMKVLEIAQAPVLINPRASTYVVCGQAKQREFTEILPELFADQFSQFAHGEDDEAHHHHHNHEGEDGEEHSCDCEECQHEHEQNQHNEGEQKAENGEEPQTETKEEESAKPKVDGE